MEEKKINKRIVFSVVAVLLLIAVVAGATYAYFSATKSSAVQTVTTATMDLAFDDTTPAVTAPSLTPIRQAEIETKAAKKSFKATNNGTGPMYLQMKLTDVDMDPELKDVWFRWALYEEGTRIGMGTFYQAATEVFMQQNMELEPGEANAKDYDLYIWIEESDEEQNDLQGKTFSGKVTVNGSMVAYDDILLFSEADSYTGEDLNEHYYNTNITQLNSPDYDNAYIYNVILSDNSMMFTNLSTIDGTISNHGFWVQDWRKMPISLTSFRTITTAATYIDGSLKHMTNLTDFKATIGVVELPSSVTNVDIEAHPIGFFGGETLDFSNLVNLENFNFKADEDNYGSKFNIILPASIKNTATINATGATVVYQ